MITFRIHSTLLALILSGLSGASPIRRFDPIVGDARAAWTVQEPGCFGIRAVDSETGRGVPLVRFRTTGSIEYWTDSNGWVAFSEPGLMDQEVWFHVDSPGYEVQQDGFGFRGARFVTTPGRTAEVKLHRQHPAERIYRVTGQGIYRDTQILGQPLPADIPQLNSGVIGQDSVQMVPYRGKLFWLWGDTNLPHYPLGVFHVTAATSSLPGPDGLEAGRGIALTYFTDSRTGRARKMLPCEESGAVWLWGLVNVPDDKGMETLVAHYSRHLSLGNMVEHGIAVWDESSGQFRKLATFEPSNEWKIPRGQAFRHRDEDGDFVYFAEPFATTRVPASLDRMLQPGNYESLAWDSGSGKYHWQRELAPVTQAGEAKMIRDGQIPIEMGILQVVEKGTNKPVEMHRGSVNWNNYRQCWVLIACEANRDGKPSHLGEIWYAEAATMIGPWKEAIKVATHPQYSFYNPRHHAVLDHNGGKVIFFEGTYTAMFSGNPAPTPRYDYNQIMYRLDLSKFAK